MGPVRYVRLRLARRRVEKYRPTFVANPDDSVVRRRFLDLVVAEAQIRWAKVFKRLKEMGD